MSKNDIPIHSCTGSASSAQVHRKVGLYASEVLCTIWSGTLSNSKPETNALELAAMLCEALEQRRDR